MSQVPSNLRISIVGAGNIGGTLAELFTKAGHTVKIANSRGPDTLKELAQRTGATPATTADTVRDAQLVVVTIPTKNVAELDKKLFTALPTDTIIIDTNNYYPARDGQVAELETGIESRWVEKQLGGRPVIKVFNNIFSHSLQVLGKPAGTPGRVALPVAGDNVAHKQTVIALLDQIGFDGVDAGGVDDSWKQQPGTPVYCTDYDVEGVKKALGKADRTRSHAVQVMQTKAIIEAFTTNKPKEFIPAMSREMMAEQYGM